MVVEGRRAETELGKESDTLYVLDADTPAHFVSRVNPPATIGSAHSGPPAPLPSRARAYRASRINFFIYFPFPPAFSAPIPVSRAVLQISLDHSDQGDVNSHRSLRSGLHPLTSHLLHITENTENMNSSIIHL